MTVFRVKLDRYEALCEKYQALNKSHPVYCLIADDAEGEFVTQKLDQETIAKYDIGLRYDETEGRLYIEGKADADYECDEVRFQIAYGYPSDRYFEVTTFLFKNGEQVGCRKSRIYDRPIEHYYDEEKTIFYVKNDSSQLVKAKCHYENLSFDKAYPQVVKRHINSIVRKYVKEVK